MYKALSVLAALVGIASYAHSVPLEKDERDVLRSAHVFHIMGNSPGSLEKLREQLSDASADQLVNKFRQLARAYSSDAGSAPSGGDLGLIVEGTMDEQFDAAIFSQQTLRVSSPQRSALGWHLILVASTRAEPIRNICEQSLTEIQRAIPITPYALFRVSLERQPPEQLHPLVMQFIGQSWGPPMNWDNNLAYMRVEPSSGSETAQVVLHAERPFAIYNSAPSACRRSARYTFQVNCAERTVALISHVEYEGRAAVGRRLIEFEYGPSRRTFQAAQTGFLAQIAEQACPSSAR